MNQVNINGRTITVPDGSNITVVNGILKVDGVVQDLDQKIPQNFILQIHGNTGAIRLDSGSVEVTGNVEGYIQADGSVTCGNVGQSVECGGSTTCKDVGWHVKAGGSVTARDVHGDVKAGGSVSIARKG